MQFLRQFDETIINIYEKNLSHKVQFEHLSMTLGANKKHLFSYKNNARNKQARKKSSHDKSRRQKI